MSDNDFYTCPYDSSHRIHKTRMARHLIKCKVNHPGVKKMTCPYNKLHLLDPHKYEHHLSECEARTNFENVVYDSDYITVDTSYSEVQNVPLKSSENWDNSGNSVSYHSHLVSYGVTNPITRRQEVLDRNKN